LKGGNTLDLYHTFVPPELRGQKIGDKLCRVCIFTFDESILSFLFQEAFNYCKENHLKVVTSCPFVQKYANETATDEERKLVVKKLGDVHVDHKE
jgi:predicted GNAT family acetyltransferase